MKPKSLNAVPIAIAPLLKLTSLALLAAEAHGDDAGLRHHTAAQIRADLFALSGNLGEFRALGEEAQTGAEGRLQAALARAAAARKAYAEALDKTRAYCATALDTLKSRFGRKWNKRWADAGFGWGTLEVSREPMLMLSDLRGHFVLHPEQENAGLAVSARRCDEVEAAFRAARLACDQARGEALAARKERNEAVGRLYRRMSGLRQELSMLLGAEDARWYWFGFRRPADGRIPGEVKEVRVQAGLAGEVSVSWERAERARSYRVTAQVVEVTAAQQVDRVDPVDGMDEVDGAKPVSGVSGVDAEPVLVGIFADREAVVRGLPAGARVVIRVSARNRSGESKAAELSVSIPPAVGAGAGEASSYGAQPRVSMPSAGFTETDQNKTLRVAGLSHAFHAREVSSFCPMP